MAWFADLAGKAETLLNNLDEQTGVALRNNVPQKKYEKEYFSSPDSRKISPKRRKSPPKKGTPLIESKSNCSPRRVLLYSKEFDDYKKESKSRTTKAPPKPYNLHNCPETLVGDMIENDYYGLKHRRLSLPSSKELIRQQSFANTMQNVEVENTILKNELTVLHKEVSQLLDKLKRTEDGNDVVSDQELLRANQKLETEETVNCKEHQDKFSLCTQFEELKLKVHELTVTEMEKQRQQCKEMKFEIELLKSRNKELEELVRELNKDSTEHKAHQTKAEKDLKHAQTVIDELETDLEKARGECRRLERDWEAYKLRVKSMLVVKDKEIKRLQGGITLNGDTKVIMEQLEVLKEEREELSDVVSHVRNECNEMKLQVEELESRNAAAECVVGALRGALKDERAAKSRADAHVVALAKELKAVQVETNQTISSLHAALREKDDEISRLKEASVASADTSALNVADYDNQASIDNDKIRYLTQTLVQRQEKIDLLLAENNMLKIQMDKLESKFKMELSALRAQNTQSVVQLQDDGRSRRARATGSFFRGLSLKVGSMLRYPVFRMFLLFYMLGLHFWVITVLLTSSPDADMKSVLYKESFDKSQPFQT